MAFLVRAQCVGGILHRARSSSGEQLLSHLLMPVAQLTCGGARVYTNLVVIMHIGLFPRFNDKR